jgi:Zn-finger nucleic acid-binding protein
MTSQEQATPKCPVDGAVLQTNPIEDIPTLQCPTCSGHWLFFGDLETLSEHHGEHLQPIGVGTHTAGESERRCPIDDTVLDSRTFADHQELRVDQCSECRGLWLDGDELQTLLTLAKPDAGEAHTTSAPTLNQRALLFLYALVKHPPYF